MVRIIDGVEYEVVWNGGEGLIPDRETKPGDTWEPPKRVYNKKSDYWVKPRGEEVENHVVDEVVVCNGRENPPVEHCSGGGD